MKKNIKKKRIKKIKQLKKIFTRKCSCSKA